MSGVLQLRRAVPDDAATILRFVRALAAYEREPDAVEATVPVIRAQLEMATPPFECLLAELDGAPVGFALYYATYSTWRAKAGIHLEDLWVEPDARRHGVARALLQTLARTLIDRGEIGSPAPGPSVRAPGALPSGPGASEHSADGARLEWSVLRWNELALEFYRSLGASEQDEWTTMRLDGDALRALARE